MATSLLTSPSPLLGGRSWQQLLQPVFVAAWVCFNLTIASAGGQDSSTSFKETSIQNPVAVLPAPYTFAVWGEIFTLAVAASITMLAPGRLEWTTERIGWWLGVNAITQLAWSLAVKLSAPSWVFVPITAGGLLLPVLRLYLVRVSRLCLRGNDCRVL